MRKVLAQCALSLAATLGPTNIGKAHQLASSEASSKAQMPRPPEASATSTPISKEKHDTQTPGKKASAARPISSPDSDPDNDIPTRVWRAKSWGSVLLTLAPGILLLDKAGIEADFIPTRYASIGLEAITSEQDFSYFGFSFGSFRETLLTVNTRIYPFTNSLNLLLGYGRRYYTLELGWAAADSVLGPNWKSAVGDSAKIEVDNEIFEIGFGNRWQMNQMLTIGIDWFTLYLPTGAGHESAPLVEHVTSEKNADKFRSMLRKLRRFPTFSIFKLQLGVSF